MEPENVSMAEEEETNPEEGNADEVGGEEEEETAEDEKNGEEGAEDEGEKTMRTTRGSSATPTKKGRPARKGVKRGAGAEAGTPTKKSPAAASGRPKRTRTPN